MALDSLTIRRLLSAFPALSSIDDDERLAVFAGETQAMSVPSGTVLFAEGQSCRGFPMVVTGCVRVVRGAPGGRHLDLYRVTPGQVCVVSTSCLLGQVPLAAHGVTAEATDLVLLTPDGFARWCTQDAFRRFVFGTFADRLADLMALAEAVAFQRLDQRLAHALLGHGHVLRLTHLALADELGTVREIVTRLLKRFEAAGWVELSRERITILDAQALRVLASGQPPTRA